MKDLLADLSIPPEATVHTLGGLADLVHQIGICVTKEKMGQAFYNFSTSAQIVQDILAVAETTELIVARHQREFMDAVGADAEGAAAPATASAAAAPRA